jgi:putative peptide zinc metalloprotease protein
MGVAFLVMFPMAYTDVNEAWKLAGRRQRLAVGAAGILVELALAAWATLAWAMLPDGHLRSAAFLLATTTWVSTLLINASPFMRFDGYFLLMDWLDLPNLHQRAFALARWRLREWLFGLGLPVPEAYPPRRRHGLMLFAFVTWIYRLVVFGGIAALVYYWGPKPLGPMLAAIEIGWFIVLPVWREMATWGEAWKSILGSRRTWFSLGILGLILYAAFVPWDRRIHAQGLLRPVQHFPVVAAGAARVVRLTVANGAPVTAGQVLIELEAPDLGYQQRATAARAASLQWQAQSGGVDAKLQAQQQVISASRGKVAAELASIRAEVARYAPTAPFAGRLFLSHPDLHPGAWVSRNEPLGMLADTRIWQVEKIGRAHV